MGSAIESDIIVKHALESEDNLRMAIKVGLAFRHLKEELVKACLVDLRDTTLKRLGSSWRIDENTWITKPLGCGLISFKRECWKESSFGLSCDRIGPAQLSYFVWVSEARMKKAHGMQNLRAHLDQEYAPGNSTDCNPWWKYVDKPLRDWDNEEALLRLHKRAELADQLSAHLVKIARITAPFVDKLYQSK